MEKDVCPHTTYFQKFHLEKAYRMRYMIIDRVEALLMLASSVICEVQP